MYKWTVISKCDQFFLCACEIFYCCVLIISLFFKLWMICDGNLWFSAMVSTVLEQKLVAYTFYLNRVITLSITEQAKQEKRNTILTVGKNNRFPLHIIHNPKNKLIIKRQQKSLTNTSKEKTAHIYLSQSIYTQSNQNHKHNIQTTQGYNTTKQKKLKWYI